MKVNWVLELPIPQPRVSGLGLALGQEVEQVMKGWETGELESQEGI